MRAGATTSPLRHDPNQTLPAKEPLPRAPECIHERGHERNRREDRRPGRLVVGRNSPEVHRDRPAGGEVAGEKKLPPTPSRKVARLAFHFLAEIPLWHAQETIQAKDPLPRPFEGVGEHFRTTKPLRSWPKRPVVLRRGGPGVHRRRPAGGEVAGDLILVGFRKRNRRGGRKPLKGKAARCLGNACNSKVPSCGPDLQAFSLVPKTPHRNPGSRQGWRKGSL